MTFAVEGQSYGKRHVDEHMFVSFGPTETNGIKASGLERKPKRPRMWGGAKSASDGMFGRMLALRYRRQGPGINLSLIYQTHYAELLVDLR